VNWAKLFAKAKENHARSSRMGAIGTVFTFGAIFAGAGAITLYSAVTHQIHGKLATATLLEHTKQCTVEYQRIGEERRKEQWSCKEAEDLQRVLGPAKFRVSHDSVARVRFQLEGGRAHEANIDEYKFKSSKLAVGATLPVVYAPDNPSDVRPKLSWEQLSVALVLFAIGIPFLMVAFGIPFSALFGWAFRGRASRAGEAVPFEHSAPTLTGASELRDGSKSTRRPDTMVTPRSSFGMRNR
jgi:hypothetical protein